MSIVLEAKYLHEGGTFEAYLLKISALKLSHPSACPVFQDLSRFSLLRRSLNREEGGRGGPISVH
jgi:hypothetical protein